MKKFLIFLLLFPVLALADAVIFSGTDVKALKQNLDLFGVVKVMSGSVDPSAGAGVAAPIGSAYLSTTSGLFLKTGVTNTGWTKNALLPVDLTSEVTGVLPVTSGGTGIADVPTNGEIPIGNGTNYTITTLTGTANQVSVTNGAGSITLATPQDIGTGSTPTFNNVTLADPKYDGINTGLELAINMSTGIVSGGFLSVDAITSRFDMDAIQGQIVDSTTNGDPKRVNVACPAFDSVVVNNLATQDVTYILIDATCTITQQATFPTPAEKRAKIFVGRLDHFNRTSISFADTIGDYLQSPMSQYFDLVDSIGPFNIGDGNKLSANGANLSMNKSAGSLFVPSYNYATNNQSPNNVTTASRTLFNFRYATQTTLAGSSVTVLDPTNYDNAGTITAVGGGANQATVQRVYLFPSNNITIQYGQATYTNLSEAIQQFQSESFVETPTVRGIGVLIGYVAIQKNCTSLQDLTCSRIITVSRLGGASTAGGVTNLQQAYNNSSQPQITTTSTSGAVEFKRGSAADTDDVIRVLDGSGASRFYVKGNGDTTITGKVFSGGQIVTGDIYASQNITGFNLSGTNTGDTEIGNDAGNIGVAKEFDFPNSQVVQTDSTNKKFRIESGNNNELYNGGFEAETLAVGWTVSNATSSSSTTRIEGSKSLSLALTGALSLSQSSTINAAQKSGVQMVASIWVNSSDVSDLQLCSLKNGSEDKCTVTGGYVQGSGWRQLTVSFLGDSTSNGLKLKSTDTTGTVLVDQAYVGTGSPVVDFTPDNVYSAKVSSAGVVSDENTDWINGNCTNLAAGVYTCTFKTGVFSITPNCVATAEDRNNIAGIDYSTGEVNVGLANRISGATNGVFTLTCQKQGADYKTSKAYVASGSLALNTTGYTAQISSTGVVSGENTDWLAAGPFAPTSTSVYSLTINSGIFTVAPHCTATTLTNDTTISVRSVSTTNVTVWLGFPGVSNIAGSFFIKCSKTGADYQAAFNPVIVGSFQGYNETPGTSRVETFSVSYGTTNATTVCSASPCSYLDQIGNAVTSITRSGTGTYSLNTSKTYSKLKCQVGYVPGASWGSQNVINCSNCNTQSFQTVTTAPALADSFGTLICQGIPQ